MKRNGLKLQNRQRRRRKEESEKKGGKKQWNGTLMKNQLQM